ncbi:MAG: riboflavin kinase, partial [Caulobacteraceae bacterium]
DITFGKGRSGDADTLRQMGERYGFGVTIVDRADDAAGDKLSSTAAREAVREGDMDRAAAILGRPFAIVGEVRAGRGKGKNLGFPTANLALGDYVRPRFGVYAVRARLEDGRLISGCAYIGPGAAVEAVEPRLEAWLFDFDEDIYGQMIEVQLIAFLRPDADFGSVQALQAQAAADAAKAREVLGI